MRQKRASAYRFLLLAILCLALSACGSGGGGGGAVTGGGGTVAATTPRFAYVANHPDSTISIYTVNATTGQLRHNGYVVAGTTPLSVTVDPSGKFAFVANDGGNVSVYTINATTGALAPVAGSPFAARTNPFSVTTTGTIQ